MINDYKLVKGSVGPTILCNAEDRTTSTLTVTMKPGELVKKGGTGGNFVIPLLDGDPELGTDEVVGLVRKESTETSSADATVEVILLVPGMQIRGKVTTAANMNTAAELLAIMGDNVAGDVSSLAQTVDEDEGDDPNVHGFKIIAGDIVKGTIDFIVHAMCTSIAPYW
jgi:hypothetical protein